MEGESPTLNIMLGFRLIGIFLIFFLTFISFLTVYVVRFNTSDKRHFLAYMLTRVPNFTTYDGTATNNKAKNNFAKEKCYNLLNFVTFKEL